MAGLNKHVQKKFKEVSSIDTIGEVFKPRWFTDPKTGEVLPSIDSISKMKKIVLVDGQPCKNTRWLEGVYKALRLVAGISTLKAEKKKVFPKLNFSHVVVKDDPSCKKDVLSIRGCITLPCRRAYSYKDSKENLDEAIEYAVDYGKFFNIGASSLYTVSLYLVITFKTYSCIGNIDTMELKTSGYFQRDNRVLAYKKLDDPDPIAIEDLLDNFLKMT